MVQLGRLLRIVKLIDDGAKKIDLFAQQFGILGKSR
jgi:hypothetical protein